MVARQKMWTSIILKWNSGCPRFAKIFILKWNSGWERCQAWKIQFAHTHRVEGQESSEKILKFPGLTPGMKSCLWADSCGSALGFDGNDGNLCLLGTASSRP